jgi:hypothetical protein
MDEFFHNDSGRLIIVVRPEKSIEDYNSKRMIHDMVRMMKFMIHCTENINCSYMIQDCRKRSPQIQAAICQEIHGLILIGCHKTFMRFKTSSNIILINM